VYACLLLHHEAPCYSFFQMEKTRIVVEALRDL